ncbi:FAD/FMN-containing dehydrogenase [Roseovarius nanhaiticus]|uniref:FAD/FMN-containing dehydrogenase n=1 Tax=Roseovarius nanhaiticus TaxID=573024 RepID=A0A1N7EP25_9RHOB|nr:FAD-binding oxidoreductase [Roseovarius nanhaiticus]SEK70522.1 FAD/FMN-containing dehydrogenase [Roseovarius nanhaiticus]SIR89685.1 FAD/FMN-containing dehydrogenase [Roseovarius nanhaiticus]
MSDEAPLLDTLRSICGDAAVLTGGDMAAYATDWRDMFHGKPLCVVRPAETAEVAQCVAACAETGTAIVPQGGNTGLAGGATPDDSGTQVIVALDRMTAIRRIDPVGMTIEVEAGAILQTVKDAAGDENRLLPISLAAEGSARIGGLIATNAGGVDVLRYGMTRGLVLGLEVVLPDGQILSRLRHLRKDNAGYDLKQLFIGTEGTLGIVTAAVLRLVPQPRHRATALIAVPDIASAIALYARAQDEVGEALSAFELISGAGLDLVAEHMGQTAPVTADWVLLIEAGSSLPSLREAAEKLLETAFEEGWATDGVLAESEAQADALWQLRESLTEAEGKAGGAIKHDISVPITGIAAFLQEAGNMLRAVAPEAKFNVFGHLGDGNLHYNVMNVTREDAAKVNAAVHDVVAAHHGSISAEHGLGQYRVAEWARLASQPEHDLTRRIKDALDPDGLINPGKVVPKRG